MLTNSPVQEHKCYDSLFTDSDDISTWARRRVEGCLDDHELCQNNFVHASQKDYLPVRLLDVQPDETEILRLLSTTELESGENISYCALSHRWGGTVNCKLTKDNINTMRSIAIKELPQNFQDAVAITKKLGVRYIWIDSLCIVQDDADEWATQSTRMGLVYANAKCVISATASKDSTGGCFRDRILKWNDCILRQSGNKSLVVRTSRVGLTLPSLFKSWVDEAPLNSRGWTFQERYLAGRILHFCEGLVLFECNTLIAEAHNRRQQNYFIKASVQADGKLHSQRDIEQAERKEGKWSPPPPKFRGFATSKQRRYANDSWKRRRKIRPAYTAQAEKRAAMLNASARLGPRAAFNFLWRFKGGTLLEKIEFHERWFELVRQYSMRDLSFGTDKAIAIAGVAYFVQQNTGLEYAAGLWIDMLPFNLLWVPPSDPGPRPVRSMPTWSWISVDGVITHRLGVHEKLPNDYTYQAEEVEQFRSKWEDVTPLISDPTLLHKQTVNNLTHMATLKLVGHLCELAMDKIEVTFDSNEDFLGGELHPSLNGLYCLPVLSFKNPSLPPKTKATQIHGILLQLKSGFTNRFQRVGYFWTVDPEVTADLLKSEGQVSTIEIV